MIRIGVIGYGYWGPNIVRNFHTHDGSEVVMVCDKSTKCQERLRKAHPSIEFTMDANDILKSPKIDLVAVVTPVWTHYELAKAALENGKHVFVEKPFTCSTAQAEELIAKTSRSWWTTRSCSPEQSKRFDRWWTTANLAISTTTIRFA